MTLFPEEVYDRFPFMLQTLALIYLCLQLIGAICVRSPSNKVAEIEHCMIDVDGDEETCSQQKMHFPPLNSSNITEEDKEDAVAIWGALKTRTFWNLWICMVLSASAGLNVVTVYKMYGNTFDTLQDDSYLALVGGIGSIANGLGRTFWGMLQDKLGSKRPFMLLTTVQGVMMLSYPFMVHSRISFGLATFIFFLCLGGNFAMAPGICAKLFGAEAGPKVFSVLFSAFAVAAIFGTALNRRFLASYGFEFVFNFMAIVSLISAISISFLGKI
mmetsp:Transcript_45379/g.68444  ORF Transcript_45379/g.68444 Transcript_45379/m.68444 type:complete len:272 (-) Transcript_45379:238-1053(-)